MGWLRFSKWTFGKSQHVPFGIPSFFAFNVMFNFQIWVPKLESKYQSQNQCPFTFQGGNPRGWNVWNDESSLDTLFGALELLACLYKRLLGCRIYEEQLNVGLLYINKDRLRHKEIVHMYTNVVMLEAKRRMKVNVLQSLLFEDNAYLASLFGGVFFTQGFPT